MGLVRGAVGVAFFSAARRRRCSSRHPVPTPGAWRSRLLLRRRHHAGKSRTLHGEARHDPRRRPDAASSVAREVGIGPPGHALPPLERAEIHDAPREACGPRREGESRARSRKTRAAKAQGRFWEAAGAPIEMRNSGTPNAGRTASHATDMVKKLRNQGRRKHHRRGTRRVRACLRGRLTVGG